VLSCYSLPISYRSPATAKVLAFSGRLTERALRRYLETARFVYETCAPGGLRRFAPGFATTVRVRLMHAQVRRLLIGSGRWSLADWGAPINQIYMGATINMFSSIVVEGLGKLGLPLPADDAEDLVALWRYSGWLSGVTDALCPGSVHEGLGAPRRCLCVIERGAREHYPM